MRIFFGALLWLAHTSVFGLDFAAWNEKSREFDLANHVYYYVEEYNEQQPHEALELLQKDYFARAPAARLSLGYTSNAVWIAVPFAGSPEKATRLVLEIASLIDSIQFSHLNERGLIIDNFTTGRDFPLSSRPIVSHNFAFPLAVERSAKGYALMRVISQGSIFVLLRLTVDTVFHANDHVEQMIFGFYFGVLLVMVLYNFFLYGSTRERTYAFYVFFVLFFFLFQFSRWGFFQEFVLPDSPRLAKYLLPAFLHLATLFQLLFAGQFFRAQEKIPRIYQYSGYLSFATFFSLVAGAVLPYRWFLSTGVLTGGISVFLVFTMSLVLYIKKIRSARYFFLAFFIFSGSFINLALYHTGLIADSRIFQCLPIAGAAVAMVLLSLAISDKMKHAG